MPLTHAATLNLFFQFLLIKKQSKTHTTNCLPDVVLVPPNNGFA